MTCLGLRQAKRPVKRKAHYQRYPVWLTPEAIAAAGRLSQVTGLSLHELVETALLGVDADDLSRELGADDGEPTALADPVTPPPPARVIAIDGRRRRQPPPHIEERAAARAHRPK